jgi:hypothetical protein
VPRGSCACGAVAYAVTGPLGPIHHCHCGVCRKAHGAAFSSFTRARAADVRVERGEDRLRRWRSSPPVTRAFCADCGGHLFFAWEGAPDALWIAAGTFDDDPGVRPDAHMFVASKAPWHDIADALPRYDGYPPEP